MTEKLRHRGPDGHGAWTDPRAGIVLGHRRLAVLDLSPAGHQPMFDASSRYVIVFNGEIYNHLEMRKELEGVLPSHRWHGHSDTETLLRGFERWGIEACLKRTVGMYALALWDRKERVLTLARDRVGEKPLYFGWQGDTFLFGSELKALRAHPAFCGAIDRDAIALYLRHGYIPAPYSIYRNIFKLQPGTFILLSSRATPGQVPQAVAYWSLHESMQRAAAQPFIGSDAEAVVALESHLAQSVALQSVADVPLGAFLSGGVDSSTVVALMQRSSAQAVKTFTIAFHESDYQEAGHAKAIARHLGTDHSEFYVTSQEAMEVVSRLPTLYDEPFGDSSAIPTFLVSQLARRQVTVSLSGDGGDELLGGYTRYARTQRIWSTMSRVPYLARTAVSRGLTALFPPNGRSSLGWKANRVAMYLATRTAQECYGLQTGRRQDEQGLVLQESGAPLISHNEPASIIWQHRLLDAMMYCDTVGYLPDNILVKVDRASMGVSLESRMPLLDHRVIEFAWSLPLHMKFRDGEGKWLLKQVLRKYVPDSLTRRPKRGFAIPVSQWLRGAMHDWAESLLGEDRLNRQGFLNTRLVRERWRQHLCGFSHDGDGIWQILMFQAWLASPA